MRILVVTRWFPSRERPVAGIFVRRDAELLARQHDARVLHLVSPREATSDGLPTGVSVPVERVVASGFRVPGRLREALAQTDVVHTHAFRTLWSMPKRPPVPWVHTEHWTGLTSPATLPPAARIPAALTASHLRRPDVVTTVSDYLGRAVDTHRGTQRPRLVIPAVVDAPANVTPFPHTGTLVGVGGMVPRKGALIAAEALHRLVGQGRDLRLVWLGDGPERATVAEYAERAGIADRLALRGDVSPAEVSSTISAADAFILPTAEETLCLGALESITRGRPVVIGANGGPSEYVTDANGELVHVRTGAAYAAATERVLDRADWTPESIRASVGDRFSTDRVLSGYAEAYRLAASAR